MTITRVKLRELAIDDEADFRHVGLYPDLKAVMAGEGVHFGVLDGPCAGPSDAQLLNLAFWQPGDVAEVLSEPVIAADQVMHSAWHALAFEALAEAGASALGLLLAESIASAFDIYLVGRLIGHAPEAQFLQTQVPAMRDAAEDANMADDAFEALLQRAAEQPEACFSQLQSLLFRVASELLQSPDIDRAHTVLQAHHSEPFAPLLHHYELVSWVLYARCYGSGSSDKVAQTWAAMRSAQCTLTWLSDTWLTPR